jgi:hypothetical protein
MYPETFKHLNKFWSISIYWYLLVCTSNVKHILNERAPADCAVFVFASAAAAPCGRNSANRTARLTWTASRRPPPPGRRHCSGRARRRDADRHDGGPGAAQGRLGRRRRCKRPVWPGPAHAQQSPAGRGRSAPGTRATATRPADSSCRVSAHTAPPASPPTPGQTPGSAAAAALRVSPRVLWPQMPPHSARAPSLGAQD